MLHIQKSTRRDFIVGSLSAVALAQTGFAGDSAAKRHPLLCFIKPFQHSSYTEIADFAAEIGWDGIECPVRKGGTIEPEAAEEELPKLIGALKKNKIDLPIIATDVEDAADPVTQKLLRTASKLGVRQYRMKHLYYDLNKPIGPQLENFRGKLRDLAQLNREMNLQGTIQNHSGKNYLGAPVWDIWELIRDLNTKDLAAYFDIGHATLEGGLSWPLHAKLLEPLMAVVSVKDFKWTKSENGSRNSWKDQWCPLGEGLVHGEFFRTLQKGPFSGPISQHFEYPLGTGKEMIAAMKKDLAVLKQWMKG